MILSFCEELPAAFKSESKPPSCIARANTEEYFKRKGTQKNPTFFVGQGHVDSADPTREVSEPGLCYATEYSTQTMSFYDEPQAGVPRRFVPVQSYKTLFADLARIRNRAGGTPNSRLNARLKAGSDP